MKQKATRKQVARAAGVSEATVSRAYNAPHSVSPGKVARVKAAAEKLEYYPNKYASALRRRGSGVILFLEMRYTGGYQWTQLRHYNAVYAEIIRTLTREAESTLYHLRLQTVTSHDEIMRLANPMSCDGIIGFNFESEETSNLLANSGLPYVCCHHTEGFNHVNRVSTDNYAGGLIQAEHLKAKGYTRPAYVIGALEDTFAHRERLRGFLSVYQESAVHLIHTQPSIAGGQKAGKRLIRLLKEARVDSVSVMNDLTAIGVIHELQRAGIEIPNDVGIIGYDNLPAISALPFQLTTVDLRLTRVYEKAFRSLMETIQKQKPIADKVEPVICPGNSTREQTADDGLTTWTTGK